MGTGTLPQSAQAGSPLSGIGVVVALAREAGCLRHAGAVAGSPDLRVGGVGPLRAGQMAEQLASAGAPALVSCGFAGALEQSFAAGAVIVADRVIDEGSGNSFQTDPAWRQVLLERLPGAQSGVIASVAEPVVDAAAKRQLYRQLGAAAVDMESAAIAAVAAHRELPFAAIRIVVDPAAMSLPTAAVQALGTSGELRGARLALGIAANPAQLIALARLAGCHRRAAAALRAVGTQLHGLWGPP